MITNGRLLSSNPISAPFLTAISTASANAWWIYFVIALVTVLIVAVSYVFGYLNIGTPKALTSKGEEAERAEREKKKKPKQK